MVRSLAAGPATGFTKDDLPRLTDKDEIRRRLRRDPGWSVYALGDLAEPMFPKTSWFEPGLTLILRDYGVSGPR